MTVGFGGVDGRAPLISMREIAELAGVQRPVVTMWRRRHPGFPGPSGGDALQPLFDAHQVADWLVTTDRITRERADIDLGLYTLGSLRAGMSAEGFIAAATALICLRYLDGGEPLACGTDSVAADVAARASRSDPADMLLRTEIESLSADVGRLAPAIDDLIESAWGEREAFERIMAARCRLSAASLRSRSLAPQLASLVARISGTRERAHRPGSLTVADLAAADGDLLVAVANAVDEDQLPRFAAAEPDPFLARLLRRRLTVHGVHQADMDIRVADQLPDEAGDPDIIVTQIPYEPGADRSAEKVLDAIGDISVRLRPESRAVVLGPADVLTGELRPYSPAERTRTAFIKDDAVEAVIRLPGGLAPFRPGYQMAIWVLAAGRATRWPGRILLADVSDRDLTSDVADALTEDVITWRRDGYHPSAHSRAFATQHRTSEFTGSPRSLLPDRHRTVRDLRVESDARVVRVAALEAELAEAGNGSVTQQLPVRSGVAAVAPDARRPAASATLGSLSRSGQLEIRQGVRLRSADITARGHHVVFGSPEVLGQARVGERMIDRAVLASYPRAQLTDSGDVIMTGVPGFGAVVDHEGLAVVEYPARILRIPEAELEQFTPRVLAALLTAEDPGVRPRGAVRRVQRLEDLRVTLLSPAEVVMFDALLAQLDARRRLAERDLQLLAELRDITTAGLVDGTLSLNDNAA